MAIYKMVGEKERLDKVVPTSFGQEGVLERSDLQRLLRDQPEVLEEGLLIIAEEFGNWEDSNRRIDLLGLDSAGRIVVIELKRGETGEHMDLQAIRYAAMVANMTYQQVVDTFQAYLDSPRLKGEAPEEDSAENKIREHLSDTGGESPAVHTEIPRIILASENFSKELTTCVLWLNDSWLSGERLDMKCVRLQPHRHGEEIWLETSVVVPLPEASDYKVKVAQRERETRKQNEDVEFNRRQPSYHAGAGEFRNCIGKIQEQFKPGLQSLLSVAENLEKEGLADLFTNIRSTGDRYSLELRLPKVGEPLVSFISHISYKGRPRAGEICFVGDWEKFAPSALPKIESLIGDEKRGEQKRYRTLSTNKTLESLELILEVITQAYREANAQLNSEVQAES